MKHILCNVAAWLVWDGAALRRDGAAGAGRGGAAAGQRAAAQPGCISTVDGGGGSRERSKWKGRAESEGGRQTGD